MNLSIETSLARPCPPSQTQSPPPMRSRSDVFPCLLPPGESAALIPRGVSLGCTSEGMHRLWLSGQRPRPHGPQFPHGLAGQVEALHPVHHRSSPGPCSSPPQRLPGLWSQPQVTCPTHLPLGPSPDSSPTFKGPHQPAPASCPTAHYAPVCLPRSQLYLGFSSAIASIGKPLRSLRVKPHGKVPLAATHHLLQGPG